ncbi:MAG TPA: STM3941 family protein [Geothrix sp.]|jgi:hypothetical protein
MQTTQPLLLRPRRVKVAGLGLGALVFVLTGLWMVREGEGPGWLIIGFFGLCLLVFLALLLPGAAYLALDSDGFTMCSLFRAHTIRWADVAGFEAALPDSYGLNHEALAQLMNQYKAASHGA